MKTRQSTVQRIALAQLASIGGTLADTVGHSTRQRLVWLGLLALPLLLPVALPGMGTAVGALCVCVALEMCTGRSLALPRWLARQQLNARVKAAVVAMVNRSVLVIALFGRPRLLRLTDKPAALRNGLVLLVAGLSMLVPVPIISFDNVLPALAIVLITWGLRLRDGLMLLAGYLATVAAVAVVTLLWWGGSMVISELLLMVQR